MFSIKRLAYLVGCVVALLVAWPCSATFQFLWLVPYKCNPEGLDGYKVYRFYAQFTDPGDRLIGVAASAANPISISPFSVLYQAPFGGHLAPSTDVIAKFPLTQWDTFVTVGVAKNDGTDQTFTTPGFPQLPVNNNTSMAWLVPANSNQGAPNYSRKVLIAQLTLPPTSSIGNLTVNIVYRPAGTSGTVTANHVSYVLLPLTAGDVNHDLNVNMDDLLLIINNWGRTGPGIPDVNDDGIINIDDLLIIVQHWGLFTGSC
jgi:hypothetical protein